MSDLHVVLPAKSKEITRLRVYNDRLQQENTMLRGAMAADDERLRVEGERAGVEHCGCDTAHWMADEILGLRRKFDDAIAAQNLWKAQALSSHENVMQSQDRLDAIRIENTRLRKALETIKQKASTICAGTNIESISEKALRGEE